jgi:hypothetical protein
VDQQSAPVFGLSLTVAPVINQRWIILPPKACVIDLNPRDRNTPAYTWFCCQRRILFDKPMLGAGRDVCFLLLHPG